MLSSCYCSLKTCLGLEEPQINSSWWQLGSDTHALFGQDLYLKCLEREKESAHIKTEPLRQILSRQIARSTTWTCSVFVAVALFLKSRVGFRSSIIAWNYLSFYILLVQHYIQHTGDWFSQQSGCFCSVERPRWDKMQSPLRMKSSFVPSRVHLIAGPVQWGFLKWEDSWWIFSFQLPSLHD